MDIVYELCADLVEKLNEIIVNEDKETIIHAYINQILKKVKPVTDFRAGLEWFNVTTPMALQKELGRKLILLDFFTYCCINCLHVLPELKALEHKYPVEEGLVVIGVHSAKFDAEKHGESVKAAVQRHDISHPVVNDVGAVMWSELDIACWPTLLLLAPGGQPLFIAMGEGHSAMLDLVIKSSLSYFKSHDKISFSDLPQISPTSHLAPSSVLSFPGRVAVSGDLLAISDTAHHRLLIVDVTSGTVKKVVGQGESGLQDGRFEDAKFHFPQGLVWLNESVIFVADTENHVIRQVNLDTETIVTLAGTGEMGTDKEGGMEVALKQPLSSPWGLTLDPTNQVLLIAMAGTHQIWGLALKQTKWWKNRVLETGKCVALAGSGREENRNSAYPMAAGFAQPSGLTVVDQSLVIADSESSSIRAISLTDGKVMAMAGGEKDPLNLFAYGDTDGRLTEAKLQHPLDVAWCKDKNCIFVADTFNHKIKQVVPSTGLCTSLPCMGLGEPGGICVDKKRGNLIVADTNNHCIKLVHLDNYSISKLELQFESEMDFGQSNTLHHHLHVGPNGGPVSICLCINFIGDKKPTQDAPQSWKLKLPESWKTVSMRGKLQNEASKLTSDIEISAPSHLISANLEINLSLVTCNEDKGQCSMENHTILIHVEAAQTHQSQINVDISL